MYIDTLDVMQIQYMTAMVIISLIGLMYTIFKKR